MKEYIDIDIDFLFLLKNMEVGCGALWHGKVANRGGSLFGSGGDLGCSKTVSTRLLGGARNRIVKVVCVSERWLLMPVGDGDSKHIGYKVKMPAAFEISGKEVTVGRLPEKADMLIPVATVSGAHARIENRGGGSLTVTDLGSTNGTYVDNKPLKPGVVTTLSPGSCVIFGDSNLAMFRVSKLETVEDKTEDQLQVETSTSDSTG